MCQHDLVSIHTSARREKRVESRPEFVPLSRPRHAAAVRACAARGLFSLTGTLIRNHTAVIVSVDLCCADVQAEATHADVLRAGISPATFQQLVAFFCRRIFTMVASLRHVRLRVATTACMYFHRFFCLRSMKLHDPRFVLAACIYIAGATRLRAHARDVSAPLVRVRAASTLKLRCVTHDAHVAEILPP